MGSITDLVDFRANDLFPNENVDWGCEKNKLNLTLDETSQKSYYSENQKRVYCEFASRAEMEYSLKRKRLSLKWAIGVYMEEVRLILGKLLLTHHATGGLRKSD